MDDLKILCSSAPLSPSDLKIMSEEANARGVSLEELIREAVLIYSAKCVTTHGRQLKRTA